MYTYHIDSLSWFTSGSSPVLPPASSQSSPSELSSQPSSSQLSSTPSNSSNSAYDNNLSAYLSKPLSNPSALKIDTFYPRLAISPCGGYLASGSSTGNVLVWDTEKVLRPGASEKEREAVVLGGASSAETSGVDWGYDSVSSRSNVVRCALQTKHVYSLGLMLSDIGSYYRVAMIILSASGAKTQSRLENVTRSDAGIHLEVSHLVPGAMPFFSSMGAGYRDSPVN